MDTTVPQSYAAKVNSKYLSNESVFVDANLVEGSIGGIGRVRVKTIRRDGSLLAVLPSSYQDIVIVQAGDITTV